MTIDLYNDKNAFFMGARTEVRAAGDARLPGTHADHDRGHEPYELALGYHGRWGEQFDIWQAVYGPVGEDGYPKQIFNKETGEIDHSVAAYWKEHYDLSAILQRDWATLGPKLEGRSIFTLAPTIRIF